MGCNANKRRRINKCVTGVKFSNFNGHYLRNRSNLDLGVLGYIGILQHKEHPPEVWHIPPGTLCISMLPDLTPLDYYLSGHVKILGYETKVDSQAALRDRIFAVAEHIRNHPNNIGSANQSHMMRAENCIAAGGL